MTGLPRQPIVNVDGSRVVQAKDPLVGAHRDITIRRSPRSCCSQGMGAVDLASTVVRRYVESYQGSGAEATQSAIDLSRLDDVVGAVDALAGRLLAGLRSRELQAAVHEAWRRTLRFYENFYVDIRDFAGNLAAATGARDVRNVCVDVQRAIEGQGTRAVRRPGCRRPSGGGCGRRITPGGRLARRRHGRPRSPRGRRHAPLAVTLRR